MSSVLSPDLNGHSVDLARRYRLPIFPGFEQKEAVLVNLDAVARGLRQRPGISPMLDGPRTNRFLRLLHRRWNAAYSLGGYCEDRRELWRGSYLPDDGAVHLGIDINLPAGTPLTVALPATLVRHVHDDCQNGGWGGVLMFELEQPVGAITHFLYAHLGHEPPAVAVGAYVAPGTIVGRLGSHAENGGWYEHLHVQALTKPAWERTKGDLSLFDGYAPAAFKNGHSEFPDPWPLLGAKPA